MKAPGMTFAQHHNTRHLQMKVRFARWDDILKAPAPSADLPHARAMWHYARGRALAARGDASAAEAELGAHHPVGGAEVPVHQHLADLQLVALLDVVGHHHRVRQQPGHRLEHGDARARPAELPVPVGDVLGRRLELGAHVRIAVLHADALAHPTLVGAAAGVARKAAACCTRATDGVLAA